MRARRRTAAIAILGAVAALAPAAAAAAAGATVTRIDVCGPFEAIPEYDATVCTRGRFVTHAVQTPSGLLGGIIQRRTRSTVTGECTGRFVSSDTLHSLDRDPAQPIADVSGLLSRTRLSVACDNAEFGSLRIDCVIRTHAQIANGRLLFFRDEFACQ
jgi:hypothetical protein